MKDKVITIWEYWDCPRKGITSYNNKFHFFECLFDESEDDYSNKYRLKEISRDALQLMEEQNNLRTKWDNKIYKTKEDKETFPILPEDKNRYELLSKKIHPELTFNEQDSFTMIGIFTKKEGMNSFGVEWKEIIV